MKTTHFVLFMATLFFFSLLAGCIIPGLEQNQTQTCSTAYDPVCGADGKTYTNICYARTAGIPVVSSGRCGAGCTDSDNGDLFPVKGTVQAGGASYTDYCVNTSVLIEYSCKNGAVFITTVTCPDGLCEDGTCRASSCKDSDNGLNTQTFGNVEAGGIVSYDKCINSSRLNEFTCENGARNSHEIDCPAGFSCSGGKCASTQESCTDSDNGKDTSAKGTTSIIKDSTTLNSSTDSCADDASVREYFCSGNNILSEVISCGANGKCTDGACITLQCTDSDGGNTPLTLGTVKLGNESKTDTCQDSGTVKEYVCQGNAIASVLSPCPEGFNCEGGFCVGGSCSDSDNGNDTEVAGVTRKANDFESDTCVDTRTLREFDCENDNIVSNDVLCPFNETCQDGACAAYEPDCIDSDGGLSFNKGTVTKGDQSFTDYCLENGNLMEYFCIGKSVKSGDFECPAGMTCRDGGCVTG